ncbi:MAG: CHAT domain-containing protein [Planctomycetes bacterium]|nr:CHAT domain-containing protein [Planctomycetota bacterium]
MIALAAAQPLAVGQAPAPAPSATATERLDEARAARASGDLARARAVLAAAFAELPANARDFDVNAESLALQLGTEALRAGAAQLAASCLRRGLESAEARGATGGLELERARLNLGTALRLAGELAAARAIQERALAALEREHPLEDVLIQNARRTLAQTVGELGDAVAEIALRQRVAESLRTRAAADPERLAAELELAAVLAVADRDTEARVSLAAIEEALADDSAPAHGLRARADALRGLLALRAGDPASAVSALERALAALPPGEGSVQVGVLSNLGIARLRLGDPAAAFETLEGVLRAQLAAYGSDHPASHLARINLIEPCRALGDLQRAHALSALALAGLERTLPEPHPTLGAARLNRALVLRDLGDLPQARALLEREVELGEPAGRRGLDARLALALVLEDLGQGESARTILEAVAAALGSSADRIAAATARASLAAVVRKAEPSRALELEQRALAGLLEQHPPTHPRVLGLRNNLAVTLLELGELATARAELEQVLALRERTLPPDHPDLLLSRRNLAWSLARLGRVAEARSAAAALADALERAARSWPEWLAPRELDERVGAAADDISTLLSLALPVREAGPDAELSRRAFELVEALRLAPEGGSRHLPGGPAESARHAAVRAATTELARAAAVGAPAAELASLRRRLDALQLAHAAPSAGAAPVLGVREFARRLVADRAYVSFGTYTRCTPQEGGALAEEERVVAFVLRADGRLERAEIGTASAVERAVDLWRTALLAPRERGLTRPDEAPELDAGRALRSLVLDPLEPFLTGIQHLAIVPEGALHLVPFDALPLESAGGRAGDERRFEVVRGAHDLVAGLPGLGPGPLLAVGGLDFDAGFDPAAEHPPRSVWDPGFPPLPASDAEIAAIVAYHERAFGADAVRTALRGAAASREAVERAAVSAVYLHCATHGWFAPESVPVGERRSLLDAGSGLFASDARELVRRASPLLLSGLAFSGANAIADGLHPPAGRVSGEELAAWDLRRCELAVLSACETGVGVRRAGLSLASLRTALHRAGARRVVTSLWRVPDESTAELMLDVYRRLWIHKQDPRAALWNAKQRLRAATDEAGRPRYGPRDWAGWVLSGPTG